MNSLSKSGTEEIRAHWMIRGALAQLSNWSCSAQLRKVDATPRRLVSAPKVCPNRTPDQGAVSKGGSAGQRGVRKAAQGFAKKYKPSILRAMQKAGDYYELRKKYQAGPFATCLAESLPTSILVFSGPKQCIGARKVDSKMSVRPIPLDRRRCSEAAESSPSRQRPV